MTSIQNNNDKRLYSHSAIYAIRVMSMFNSDPILILHKYYLSISQNSRVPVSLK